MHTSFNPPNRLDIADFTQIQLCGPQIRMPEKDFVYNFNRNAGS
jgi:hypothetical protein